MMRHDRKVEEALAPLRQKVKEQGDMVRRLKEEKALEVDIYEAVRLLKERKRDLESMENSLVPSEMFVNKTRLDDVVKRRYFWEQSFSIYGGISGLVDYGPYGAILKRNIIRQWEKHFEDEEDLFFIDSEELTPEPVLRASGHVDRFADLMVKDVKTGDCHRLDRLIKSQLEKLMTLKSCSQDRKNEIDKLLAQLDGLDKEQLAKVVEDYAIKAPSTGNGLTEPVEFNLMLPVPIGPTGSMKCFLRPELAQGIFVNFKSLLQANQGNLPFGACQVGKAYRNEISPRGLTRRRAFTLAEIEYFVDPVDKSHAKYHNIKDMKLNLYSAQDQMSGEDFKIMSLGEAVDKGIVANEVLAYFLARINTFMLSVGIDPKKMRFRQHMSNEMAHYATDCWDCECYTSGGWLECVGCADRSCYDLSQHADATKVKLVAQKQLESPKEVEFIECIPVKHKIGTIFKDESKLVLDELMNANDKTLVQWQKDLENGIIKLNIGGKYYGLLPDMVIIRKATKTIHVEDFVPNVIEPSFGIDRILFVVMEHNFHIREDPLRTYFDFPISVAPFKCSVLALSNDKTLHGFAEKIKSELKQMNVRMKCDGSSESIGKRYARMDEIGVPYVVTVDFDTIEDSTVTLRHCESRDQIRLPIADVSAFISDLVAGKKTWDDALDTWPMFDD